MISKTAYDDVKNNEWDVQRIYAHVVDLTEEKMIKDGYSSTQSILDSWYELLDSNSTRPLNYADLKLLDYKAQRNEDDGFVAKHSQSIAPPYGYWSRSPNRIHTLDINGDGQTDILLGPESNGNWHLIKSFGNAMLDQGKVLTGYSDWQTELNRIREMDVNGDGMDDLVIGPKSNGDWYVHLSNGNGFVEEADYKWASAYGNWYDNNERIWEIDFNGDKKEDILIGPSPKGEWFLLESTGSSFINRGRVGLKFGNWASHGDRIRALDLDNDGYDGDDSHGNSQSSP